MDTQGEVPADLDGRDRVGLARGTGGVAPPLNPGGAGGPEGPPAPVSSPFGRRSRALRLEREADLMLPGERRVYRVDGIFVRAWVDAPQASVEIWSGGRWIWTLIPSASILAHPRAQELTDRDLAELPNLR